MTAPPKVLELRWRQEVPPPKDFIVTFGLEVKRSRKSQREPATASFADRLPVRYCLLDDLADANDVETFAPSARPIDAKEDPFEAAANRVRMDDIILKLAVPFVYSGCRSVVVDGKALDLISIEFGKDTKKSEVAEESVGRKRKRFIEPVEDLAVPLRLYYYGIDTSIYHGERMEQLRDVNKAREMLLHEDKLIHQLSTFEDDEEIDHIDLGHIDLPNFSLYVPAVTDYRAEVAGLEVDGEIGDYFDVYKDHAQSGDDESLDYPSSDDDSDEGPKCPIIKGAFRNNVIRTEAELNEHLAKFGTFHHDSDSDDSVVSWNNWD